MHQAVAARAAGVDVLLVVNQNNAQQSNTTIGVTYDQLVPFLEPDPAWRHIPVLGLDDYSMASGFEPLLIDFMSREFQRLFGRDGIAPDRTCLLLACHGNPLRITRAGDPGDVLMRRNYAALHRHFAGLGFDTYIAFQNHGGRGTPFPQNLFPWSLPADTDVVPRIAAAPCSQVLVSGVISFVVDSSETLFDEGIEDRRVLHGKRVAVTSVFNDDPKFAAFLAQVINDALHGKGPVRRLNSAA